MGLFIRDDNEYDESRRMTGFNRYKQLLSFYAGHWTLLNLIATVSAMPLAIFIISSILMQSVLVMIPLSFLGGVIFGPFLSTLFDSIQRALRDDTQLRWRSYRRALRQNSRSSLIPGGILGLIAGSYSFMFYMMYCSTVRPSLLTVLLILFSFILAYSVFILFWTQFVLFHQSLSVRLRNIILFTSKYLWKMLLISVLAIVFIAIIVLFAPLTLLVVPFIGFWYILFLSQFIIYDSLNEELKIEELYQEYQQSHPS